MNGGGGNYFLGGKTSGGVAFWVSIFHTNFFSIFSSCNSNSNYFWHGRRVKITWYLEKHPSATQKVRVTRSTKNVHETPIPRHQQINRFTGKTSHYWPQWHRTSENTNFAGTALLDQKNCTFMSPGWTIHVSGVLLWENKMRIHQMDGPCSRTVGQCCSMFVTHKNQ